VRNNRTGKLAWVYSFSRGEEVSELTPELWALCAENRLEPASGDVRPLLQLALGGTDTRALLRAAHVPQDAPRSTREF
jgi:hypothetical protein